MKKLLPYLLCIGTFFNSHITFASPAGNIDFADLSKFYGEPKVEINLGASLIGMIGAFSKHEDPDLGNLLNKLEHVKVRIYNVNDSTEKAFETVDSITTHIRKNNWQPIVSVNEPHEKVRIFAKSTQEVIDGIVVMVVSGGEGGEAVFINLVGEIHPSEIQKVTDSLNVGVDLNSTKK